MKQQGPDPDFFHHSARNIHRSFFPMDPDDVLLEREAGAVRYVFRKLPEPCRQKLEERMPTAKNLEAVEYYLRVRGKQSGLTDLFQAVLAVCETDGNYRKYMITKENRAMHGYVSLAGYVLRSVGLLVVGFFSARSFWND